MEFGRIVKATVSADGHVPLLQSLFFCQPLAKPKPTPGGGIGLVGSITVLQSRYRAAIQVPRS